MAGNVQVIGLRETQLYLAGIDTRMQIGLLGITKKFAEKISIVAKEILAVGDYIDTGALFASIHTEIVAVTPFQVIVAVVAGDPNIKRGSGEFEFSSKRGGKAQPTQATSEYAAAVEEGEWTIAQARKGPAKYMQGAFDWGKANLNNSFKNLLLTITIDR